MTANRPSWIEITWLDGRTLLMGGVLCPGPWVCYSWGPAAVCERGCCIGVTDPKATGLLLSKDYSKVRNVRKIGDIDEQGRVILTDR